MFAEVVAIFSAMGWSGDSVLVRLGLRKSNIFAAMLVSYTLSVTLFGLTFCLRRRSIFFARRRCRIFW